MTTFREGEPLPPRKPMPPWKLVAFCGPTDGVHDGLVGATLLTQTIGIEPGDGRGGIPMAARIVRTFHRYRLFGIDDAANSALYAYEGPVR